MNPMKDTVVKALNGVQDLPTLPSVVERVEKLLHEEKTTAQDIAKVISADPTLTSNVLRVVNCAYYAARAGTITSVRHAVARLGLREVSRICTVLTVIETFRGFGTHLDHKAFWKHSLMTAIATRIIHRRSQCAFSFEEDDAYVAGLLHDIGILILDQYFPALYERTRKHAEEKVSSYIKSERRVIGMDHGEIGAVVLKRWSISPVMVQAVTWHHQPSRCDAQYRGLASAVHLADFICLQLEAGHFTEDSLSGVSENVWVDLDLSPDHIPAILDNLRNEARQCEYLLLF